jgi:hypothetical protein
LAGHGQDVIEYRPPDWSIDKVLLDPVQVGENGVKTVFGLDFLEILVMEMIKGSEP